MLPEATEACAASGGGFKPCQTEFAMEVPRVRGGDRPFSESRLVEPDETVGSVRLLGAEPTLVGYKASLGL